MILSLPKDINSIIWKYIHTYNIDEVNCDIEMDLAYTRWILDSDVYNHESNQTIQYSNCTYCKAWVLASKLTARKKLNKCVQCNNRPYS